MKENNKIQKVVITIGLLLVAVFMVMFITGKPEWLFISESTSESDNSGSESFYSTLCSDKASNSNGEDSSPSSEVSFDNNLNSYVENLSSSSNTSSASSFSSASNSVSSSSDSSSIQNSSSSSTSFIESKLKFRNKNLLNQHYEKHGKDMGFASAAEYEAAAGRVPYTPGVLHKIEAEDGDDVYYIEGTNEFVVISTDGYIRTYFNPDRGIDYFNRQ